ncbi:hypothetical protein [Cytobacillus purgationiresistens]|uniref:Uncharacterized protein n=1 Tax=Cytobacillus purgationiresistens TaxID=863449 RepID=A0ABU0AK22_9BACI|nr:hypothetical protein [Cytobacillus purgationiresistens]MDQ0271603.1 hypothetical protein [Cytobacillus purgationiresistens]
MNIKETTSVLKTKIFKNGEVLYSHNDFLLARQRQLGMEGKVRINEELLNKRIQDEVIINSYDRIL